MAEKPAVTEPVKPSIPEGVQMAGETIGQKPGDVVLVGHEKKDGTIVVLSVQTN